MGPSAPPNRLGRPGSSHYLIDSIGVSPSYRLSRPFRPPYVLCFCLSPPALNSIGEDTHTSPGGPGYMKHPGPSPGLN